MSRLPENSRWAKPTHKAEKVKLRGWISILIYYSRHCFSVLFAKDSSEIVAKLNPNQVRTSMKRLSGSQIVFFGADQHHFAINPPLPDVEVVAFEQIHRISLPADYRHFITHIGNGGAGPSYGIFPLGQMDENYNLKYWFERDGFLGVLSDPFPLIVSWNNLSGKPSDQLIDTDPDEYDRQFAAFEEIYWNTVRINGAFPICHIGCGIRIWLVVSGDEAGHLWRDGRADYAGLSPLTLKDKSLATFSSWYE